MTTENAIPSGIKNKTREKQLKSLLIKCSGERNRQDMDQLFDKIAPLVDYIIAFRLLEKKAASLVYIDRDDLIQIGFYSILKNLNTYNPKISAVTWLSNQIWWGISGNLRNQIYLMHQRYRQYFLRPVEIIESIFLADHNRSPNDEEIYAEILKIKDRLHLPPNINLNFKWFQTNRHRHLKIMPFTDYADHTPGDNRDIWEIIEAQEQTGREFMYHEYTFDEMVKIVPSSIMHSNSGLDYQKRKIIANWMEHKLSPKEKKIVVLRFYHDMTLKATGENMHPKLCKERVRQVLKRALDKLRKMYNITEVGK